MILKIHRMVSPEADISASIFSAGRWCLINHPPCSPCFQISGWFQFITQQWQIYNRRKANRGLAFSVNVFVVHLCALGWKNSSPSSCMRACACVSVFTCVHPSRCSLCVCIHVGNPSPQKIVSLVCKISPDPYTQPGSQIVFRRSRQSSHLIVRQFRHLWKKASPSSRGATAPAWLTAQGRSVPHGPCKLHNVRCSPFILWNCRTNGDTDRQS